ncbi:Hypothetical predicted protein [Mytilus galloprovincialis]|uniref:CCHC-type domain-containing protein n=1 Tax=Mytilus galloprovincialis TaxID=29158 RepID=A0A8B6CSR6_MYTGA|nr:Hypothetical predicted protein [Mytilus galloprovincialis]
MKTIKNLNVLNDDRENRKLLSKFPDWIVTRWGRIVAQHKSDHHTFPSFQTFSVFIERESTIANDPVTSLNSLKTDSTPRNTDTNFRSVKNDRDTPRRNAFATETKSTSYDRTKESNSGANKNCLFCHKAGHILDSCRNYLAKSVQERKEFAKRTGLCFACLGSGHLSKQCNKRATCSICTKRHPTAFHGDVVKQYPNNSKQPTPCNEEKELYKSQTGAVLMSITESCGKSSMIVPVYLSHTDNQQHEILVYALLDTQSDTTFILDNTRQTLGLSGTDVKLSLSTMHSQNSIVDSCKIDGLIVRAYDSDMKITLPSTFARDILPANRAHIPTGDMARRWPQLEKIASQLMPVSDCEFGLLIGYNCARALTPREVIPTTDDGPYAQKTDLGWGIVGIVDPSCIDNALTTHSHRMIAFESHVLFTIRNCTKLSKSR